jgi:hypothetical protein
LVVAVAGTSTRAAASLEGAQESVDQATVAKHTPFLVAVQKIATIHWFSLHSCLTGSWQRSVRVLIMMRNHRLRGRIVPRRGGWLLGGTCRFEVCDVRRNDLGLPFLNRYQGRLYLKERLSDSKSCTYVLEGGKYIFTDTVLVKLWLHGGDDIVDNGAINVGSRRVFASPHRPLL